MSNESVAISSLAQMEELGMRIGNQLVAGDVVSLNGELGVGKTALTRGIAQALGIVDVVSPTFVIAKIYPGKIPLIHVDAYRLIVEERAAIDDLDLEVRTPFSITIIEWGRGFAERISEKVIEINIEFGSGMEDRIVNIKGFDR